jgi:2-C-methyl-D-erythritol 4-phosphate cytidylyltransferase
MSGAVPPRSEVSVLVPAAGAGLRLGMGPKALLPLHGRPVLEWVADKARALGDEVIVAGQPGMPVPAGCRFVEGGATRQESVRRLAEAATRPWVLLWDAARPFSSHGLASRVLAAARETGAAAPVLAAELPVALLRGGRLQDIVPSADAGTPQTPHAFSADVLRAVTQRAHAAGWEAQSTLELVLRAGQPVAIVPGEKLNIKLTTPEDWQLAQGLRALLG